MITKPTVFILGAGASMPYGFPSGADLRRMIIDGEATSFLKGLIPYAEVDNFIASFRDSEIYSIDAFLTARPDLNHVGKLAIAKILCDLEDPKWINAPHKAPFNQNGKQVDHWYALLWNKMLAGTPDLSKPESILQNRISIITFNYDRSLEYFLYTVIRNTFNTTSEKAFEVLNKIPIIHFYGCLSAFSPSKSTTETRTYFNSHSQEFIVRAASHIRVMPEQRQVHDSQSIIQDMFRNAHSIIFLGFSYDPLNLSRLGIRDTLATFSTLPEYFSVAGSALGMTISEIGLAAEYSLGNHRHGRFGGFQNNNSTMTLRENAHLLR